MSSASLPLPVGVLDVPHWRVVFRPHQFEAEALESLADCRRAVEANRVSLRGWDYPHISPDPTEFGYRTNWIESWSSFMGHLEYWRFYQSRQFVHLFSVRESTRQGWREKLKADAAGHSFGMEDFDWDTVPGFISIENFIYCVTEIFEFATRLCQAQVYNDRVLITIELHDIRGFVLTTGWNRAWYKHCASSEEKLSKTWDVAAGELIGSQDAAVRAAIWFFERFGWEAPSPEVIRRDARALLERKI